jgi:hypothetical protein
MWSVGFKEKALRRQRHFDGKGSSLTKAKALRSQSLFEIKDEGTSKRKTARRQRQKHAVVRRKSVNILFSNNHSSHLGTVGSEDVALPETLYSRQEDVAAV